METYILYVVPRLKVVVYGLLNYPKYFVSPALQNYTFISRFEVVLCYIEKDTMIVQEPARAKGHIIITNAGGADAKWELDKPTLLVANLVNEWAPMPLPVCYGFLTLRVVRMTKNF